MFFQMPGVVLFPHSTDTPGEAGPFCFQGSLDAACFIHAGALPSMS